MSYMLTTDQVYDRLKDVTRRNGWKNLKPGERLRAVRKAMGLKNGEKHELLAIVEVVDVRRERLDAITSEEVIREGFPGMTPEWFIEMFCRSHKGVTPESIITRIEFKYLMMASKKDKQGFFVPARSGCCGEGLVRFDAESQRFVTVDVWDNVLPPDVRCHQCNREVAV